MALQTSVRSALPAAVNGQIADARNRNVEQYLNTSKQEITFTVTAADTTTTVTINGSAYTFTATGSHTTTALAASVAALIEAGEASNSVSASAATGVITVVASAAGTTFTYAATANNTAAVVVPTSALVPVGIFVTKDVNDTSTVGVASAAHVPGLATDITNVLKVGGLTVLTNSMEKQSDGTYGYEVDSVMNVMSSGKLVVTTESAVTPATGVYVRFAASGSNTQLGSIRGDADSTTAALLPNSVARFTSSAGAGELVELEINLP